MAETEVRINITGKDNTKQATASVQMNFKQLGESMTKLGTMASMAFTAPIVGAFAMAAKSSVELQAALLPIQGAFTQISTELGNALAPLVKEITPMFVDFAKSVVGVIQAFRALPMEQQKMIGGFILTLAAIGPVLIILGQVATAIGTIGTLIATLSPALAGIGAVFGAVVFPVVAFVAALASLITILAQLSGQMTTLKQVISIGAMMVGGQGAFKSTSSALGLTGKRAAGGPVLAGGSYLVGERGPEVLRMGAQGGQIYANGSGGANINVTYSPMFSTADQNELKTRLTPLLNDAIRQAKRG